MAVYKVALVAYEGQPVSPNVSLVYLRVCSLAFGAPRSIEMAIGVFEYKEEQRRDLFLSDYYQPLRIEVVWITFDRAI